MIMPNDSTVSSKQQHIYVFKFRGNAKVSYENYRSYHWTGRENDERDIESEILDRLKIIEKRLDSEEPGNNGRSERDDANLASELFKDASSIQKEVSSIIKSSLPTEIDDVSIDTRIEFYNGSLAWVGEVVVVVFAAMNVLSAISGTVDFFDKVSGIIEFAVQTSVARAAKRRNATIHQESIRSQVIPPVRVQQGSGSQAGILEHILRQQDIQNKQLQEILQRQTLIIDHFLRKQEKKDNNALIYLVGLIPWLIIIGLIYLLIK
jgi:hypothetical protein